MLQPRCGPVQDRGERKGEVDSEHVAHIDRPCNPRGAAQLGTHRARDFLGLAETQIALVQASALPCERDDRIKFQRLGP